MESKTPVRETSPQEGHYHYHEEADSLVGRMKRVEGQARGVQRMIEEDRYCPDIVQQLNALISASREVSLRLLQHHIEGCVVEAVQQGNSEAKVKELMVLLRRAVDQR